MFDLAVIGDAALHPRALADGDAYYLRTYAALRPIDDIVPNRAREERVVRRVMATVRDLPAAGDFTLTRLHRHFELARGERLVETDGGDTGAPVLKPALLDPDKTYLPIGFKFARAEEPAAETGSALAVVPLEFRKASADEQKNAFGPDRVRVIAAVGAALLDLGLLDTFGLAIRDIPEPGTVWTERTYLSDRSHRLTVDG